MAPMRPTAWTARRPHHQRGALRAAAKQAGPAEIGACGDFSPRRSRRCRGSRRSSRWVPSPTTRCSPRRDCRAPAIPSAMGRSTTSRRRPDRRQLSLLPAQHQHRPADRPRCSRRCLRRWTAAWRPGPSRSRRALSGRGATPRRHPATRARASRRRCTVSPRNRLSAGGTSRTSLSPSRPSRTSDKR